MNLAGVHEIAEAFQVDRSTVYYWRRSNGFPEPLTVLKTGPVYDLDRIREWKHTRDNTPFATRYRQGGGVVTGDNTDRE